MISNYELYGTEDVPPVPKEVAIERLILLKARLSYLVNLPFMEQRPSLENEVLKAMEFWRKMSNMEEAGI